MSSSDEPKRLAGRNESESMPPSFHNESPASNIIFESLAADRIEHPTHRRRASMPPMDAAVDAYVEMVRGELTRRYRASNTRSAHHEFDSASGLDLETSTICLAGLFADLQQFKEENGHLVVPVSHPSVSCFIKIVLTSNEMGPFAQTILQNGAQCAQRKEDVAPSASKEAPPQLECNLSLDEGDNTPPIPSSQLDANICNEKRRTIEMVREIQNFSRTLSPPLPPQMVAWKEDNDETTRKSLAYARKSESHPATAPLTIPETAELNDEESTMIVNDSNIEVGLQPQSSSPNTIPHDAQIRESLLKSDEEKTTNNGMHNEREDGGECAHESSVTQSDNEGADDSHTYIEVIAAQVQVAQPTVAVAEEESQALVPKIGFDDVFADLQLFKEENGNLLLPTSHLFVSRFIEKLSSHEVEPFLTIVETRASEMQIPSHHCTAPPSALELLSTFSSRLLLRATLVEDGEEGEVFIAEEVSFWERKWKQFASAMCIFLLLLAVLLSLTLTDVIQIGGESLGTSVEVQPTLTPTFDPRSTLEIIQERGHIRCGMRSWHIDSTEGLNRNLCRSIAAVVVGHPDSFEGVPVTTPDRWQLLHDRTVDIVIQGDTHTIEREIKETSTGVGFTFSSPYTYDGMVYFGNDYFVQCAEEQKRYDDCVSLLICVTKASTHHKYVKASFPFDHFKVGSTAEEITDMLFNGTCNVAAYDKSAILGIALSDDARDRNFTLGSKMMTKEPLAAVTRNTDREFSDIINWVIQALFYGEEQGLVKDPALCHNYANYTELGIHDGPDYLNFMNAVYCVGNYGEIYYGEPNNRGRNQINNGTGMLYAIPFGNIGNVNIVDPESTLVKIRNEGSLKCGVVVPDEFVGDVMDSDELVGMGVEYCRALAAALFIGDSEDMNILSFPESQNSSYFALASGEVDVLVGGKVQLKYDFALSPSLEGFHFSTPYYYGNKVASSDAIFTSVVTREDDALFASFVNSIVLSTIYAEENRIDRERSREMPLVSVFGSDLNWALRDAIAYSGSYEQIYRKHFGIEATEVNRGRNTLNEGSPIMLSFPGLLG